MNKRLLLVGIILLLVGVLTAPFAFGPTLGVTGFWMHLSGSVAILGVFLITKQLKVRRNLS